MRSERVTYLYLGLQQAGAPVWLDGGWGVDALLGRQTREHEDLDVVVQGSDLPVLRAYLSAQGFSDFPRNDTRPWNFVLANAAGELVDVHVIDIGPAGEGVYGPQENGQSYPSSSLLGLGAVDGLPVRCLSAEYQLESHTGYAPRWKDHQDVSALVQAFGLIAPPEYRTAETSS